MDAYRTANAIGRAIRGNPVFNGVYIYTHGKEIDATGNVIDITGPTVDGAVQPQLRLPHVEINVSVTAPLAASSTIGMMKAEITVRSQADDETAAVHTQRDNAVRAVMADTALLASRFFATGGVLLKGRAVPVMNAPGVEARAWATPHTYALGVEAT